MPLFFQDTTFSAPAPPPLPIGESLTYPVPVYYGFEVTWENPCSNAFKKAHAPVAWSGGAARQRLTPPPAKHHIVFHVPRLCVCRCVYPSHEPRAKMARCRQFALTRCVETAALMSMVFRSCLLFFACLSNCVHFRRYYCCCCQTLVTTRLATLREFVFSVALHRGGAAATPVDDTSSEWNNSSGSRPNNNNANGEGSNSHGAVRRSPPSADGRSGGSYNHGGENNSTKTNHHHRSDTGNKIMDASQDAAVVV